MMKNTLGFATGMCVPQKYLVHVSPAAGLRVCVLSSISFLVLALVTFNRENGQLMKMLTTTRHSLPHHAAAKKVRKRNSNEPSLKSTRTYTERQPGVRLIEKKVSPFGSSKARVSQSEAGCEGRGKNSSHSSSLSRPSENESNEKTSVDLRPMVTLGGASNIRRRRRLVPGIDDGTSTPTTQQEYRLRSSQSRSSSVLMSQPSGPASLVFV